MSLSREIHQERMRAMALFDLESSHQCANALKMQLEQRTLCRKKLSSLRTFANRMELFRKVLLDLLTLNQINQIAMTKMLEFIEKTIVNKIDMSDAFTTGFFVTPIAYLRKSYPELDSENLKKVMKETGLLVDQMEHELTMEDLASNEAKHTEYLALQGELAKYEEAVQSLKQTQSELDQQIKTLYKSENITSANELADLCAQLQNENIEIMLIEFSDDDIVDDDLAAVIKMKAEKALKKGAEFILMSYNVFDQIIKEGHAIDGVNKISFLHHGSDRDRSFSYVAEIENYIDHLPALKEIVVRGCGTANNPESKEVVHTLKMSNAPYEQTPSIQGAESVVIQQKQDKGKLYTKASWVTLDENRVRHMHQIADMTSVSKIDGKKPNDQQIQELEQIEGMPLLQHGSEYVGALRARFFNQEQAMSDDEIAKAKKAFRRARTEHVTVSQDDMLSRIWARMSPEQRRKVSVKAYIGAYGVRHGRVIPEDKHDQGSSPKAVQIGPESFPTVKEEKKDTAAESSSMRSSAIKKY